MEIREKAFYIGTGKHDTKISYMVWRSKYATAFTKTWCTFPTVTVALEEDDGDS